MNLPYPSFLSSRPGRLISAVALTASLLPGAAGSGATTIAAPDALSTAVEAVTPPAPPAGAPTEPLDLQSAVRIALDQNPALKAAAEGVAAAAETIGVARAAYYPEVGVDYHYRRFDTHVFLPSGLPALATTLGATDDWSASVRVGWALYDSGMRRAETAAARSGFAAIRNDAERVRQDVVFEVHQAFYRVLAADAALEAARARAGRAGEHLRLAEIRKAAGAVPQADVLRARVEVADARLAIVRAEGELRTAQGVLNTAMGLPAARPVEVAPPAEGSSGAESPDPEAVLARALRQRPELAATKERIAAADQQAAALAASFGPRVRAEIGVGRRDSGFVPEDQDWSVGVALQIPIFTGFAKTHRVERARREARMLEAQAVGVADQIGQEVWAATTALASAGEAVRQATETRSEAEQSVAFARARYEAGAGTLNDLLDAESALTQAETSLVAAELSYRLATALVERAQGQL